MRALRFLFALMLAIAAFAPLPVRACPMCTEFVESASEAEDTDNFPKAVNQTIYFMLGVPYTALMVVGFFTWRGMTKNEAYRQTMREREAKDKLAQDESGSSES